ncbi:MAG: hypothetical protein IK990_19025, partial [Ruminiclostridium sp.]|nr:hypothetical protein [Ruminiclostridium sp.]
IILYYKKPAMSTSEGVMRIVEAAQTFRRISRVFRAIKKPAHVEKINYLSYNYICVCGFITPQSQNGEVT